MDLEFFDLSYSVRAHPLKSIYKQVLKSITGQFPSNKLTAILGPSGSGKTSLLNALSGYKLTGVEGAIKIDGQLCNKRAFHKSVCYITQDDVLEKFLSVNELMEFATNLKLSSSVDSEKKQVIIDTILGDLGLLDQKATRTECLSGGQKKRLSIALELINNPPVFFLDEPTTGLDYVSAKYCLQLLKGLSRQGRTVVCTIHQPSAKLFHLFDHVYYMAQGQCVYQGTPGNLVPYLNSAGLTCPESYNPADYIIECTDAGNEDNINILSSKICNGRFSENGHIQISADQLEYDQKKFSYFSNGQIEQCPEFNNNSKYVPNYPINSWQQFCIIYSRLSRQLFRNKLGLKFQLANYISSLLAGGVLYFNKADDATELFTHVKFCLGLVIFFVFTPIMLNVVNMPIEVPLLKKETFNRWYSLKPYFFALTLSKVPLQIFFNTLFVLGLLLLGGFPLDLFRIVLFSLIANLTFFVSDGVGLVVGSIFNITNGCAVAPAVVGPLLGMQVFGLDFPKLLPTYFKILLKLSYVRCSSFATLIVAFGYDRPQFKCTDLLNCPFDEPKILLNMIELENDSVWYEMGYLVGFLLLFQVVGFVFLKMRISGKFELNLNKDWT